MYKNRYNSKFLKLIFVLIFILLIEFFLIYRGYKTNHLKTFKDYNAKRPIVIIVDVCDSVMYIFQDGKVIKTYTVAGGKPSTPSPIGTWTIISKGTWGEGFGGRWMGFNVPWGKYGIHGTIYPNSIGWNSSHGCIRMRNNDVAELYKITKHGTKVIIWGGPYGNFGSYLRTLKPGMRGSDVYELQKMLRAKNYYKATPDGIYGDYLKNVVHKFQKDNKLKSTDTIGFSFYEKLGVKLID
ncbi:L,D-transpeptidase family protein [Clostridium aestuarii]|uniref:L,D-transpeptidase family protein n=1 Tax=Clostridium aestuarii TaxID=338193 RepID=A0ABT4CV44_9CLOT|nr:L,D-transpeptidase family protein [Clostridium aestuarii]MCY6482836.1 L,D-transpeptidase family protein [Clostridium aestuarii]